MISDGLDGMSGGNTERRSDYVWDDEVDRLGCGGGRERGVDTWQERAVDEFEGGAGEALFRGSADGGGVGEGRGSACSHGSGSEVGRRSGTSAGHRETGGRSVELTQVLEGI